MMPTQQQHKQEARAERQDLDRLNTEIGKNVLQALGHPRDLRAVQVRPLWDAHYRVNVFVGVDLVSAKVAHSYFLVVDGEGKVVTSTPGITKQY